MRLEHAQRGAKDLRLIPQLGIGQPGRKPRQTQNQRRQEEPNKQAQPDAQLAPARPPRPRSKREPNVAQAEEDKEADQAAER